MLVRLRGRLAWRTAAIPALSSVAMGVLLHAFDPTGVRGLRPLAILLSGVVVFATGLWIHERLVSARLRRLIDFLSKAEPDDGLTRLPSLGPDEIGQTGIAINELVNRITSLRVSYIDQRRELALTQEELRLKAALAEQSEELAARLKERALLFDVLRVSASSTELGAVLNTVTERVGTELSFREAAILIRESPELFVARSAFGFAHPSSVLGKSVKTGEGIAGEVARAGHAIVVRDVGVEPDYLAYWGAASREGSFAAVPIAHQNRLLGIFTATRPPDRPFSETEVRVLCAIADQAGLVIRNAQLFQEMRELSTHDDLTKLANRRLLLWRVSMELERAKRFSQPLAVLMIDIDHFKSLNDRCGHPTGDAALQEVAKVLLHGVRKVDTVARFGGEEFAVLLPRADAQEAARVAEALRLQVAGSDMPGGLGQPGGRLTISVGVAALLPTDDGEGSSLLSRADQALYAAKRRGRNCVSIYEGAITPALRVRDEQTRAVPEA